jgi:serine/threonine protein kinase
MQHLQPNTTLQGGKYRIERVLGQGGFGITYLAVQSFLQRKVAIKEFFMQEYCYRNYTSVATSTPVAHEIVERFKRKFITEASIIAKFRHPNIIDIYDVFIENDTAYYVMEFIEGKSLEEIVRQQGALIEATAIDYIRQVGAALDCMHQQKTNHLDVKPSNIMLRNNNKDVVLIDFGISKQYDESGKELTTLLVGISDGYTPIEQYDKNTLKDFSPQTDVYALGATLYKLLTGLTPPSALSIIGSGISIPGNIPANLRRIVEKAMSVNKNNRYSSISSFCLDLCDIKNDYYHKSDNESTFFGDKSHENLLYDILAERSVESLPYNSDDDDLVVFNEEDYMMSHDADTYKKAKNGSADAQYLVGIRLVKLGLKLRGPASFCAGLNWLEKSVDQEYKPAINIVIEMAVQKEKYDKYVFDSSIQKYVKAAVQGEKKAQRKLIKYLRNGGWNITI